LAGAFISQINTHKCILSQLHTTALPRFPLKHYTLAGLEPWHSVPEADVMSIVPRRQDKVSFIIATSKCLPSKFLFHQVKTKFSKRRSFNYPNQGVDVIFDVNFTRFCQCSAKKRPML
jgi:hypothetical protein